VLRVNASTTGVLFDLPAVVEAAKVTFDRSVVAHAEFFGGTSMTFVGGLRPTGD
jgi:hypothetical protein